jgi:type VI protein secretion system component Hcp
MTLHSAALDGGKIMSKKSDDKIIPQKADDQSKLVELNEQQLDMVAGGTKITDKASTKLFELTATGTHIKDVKITT